MEEEDDGSLVIPAVTPEHEGVYTISANNTGDEEPETESIRVVIGKSFKFILTYFYCQNILVDLVLKVPLRS